MAHVSVEIPARLVLPVRDTVFLLYQATAEALHFALRALPAEAGEAETVETLESLEEVHEHRARLADLDAVLVRLGWPPGPVADALELSAPREILHDALHGALIDAGERLASACDGRWRGEVTARGVRATAAEVIGLDRLLRRIRE